VTLRITPEPGEDERRAIVATLAAEDVERTGASPWAQASLPRRADRAVDRPEPEPYAAVWRLRKSPGALRA